MTHMPGVSVPPRPMEFEHDEDLQRLKKKLAGEEEPKPEEPPEPERRGRRRPGGALTQRLVQGAGKLGAGAGLAALERTLEAGRRSSDMGVIVQGPSRQQVTGVVARPATPSFASLVPGALVAPLRKGSLVTVLGMAALLWIAGAILLEVSPLVGTVALVVAGVELLALRVKLARDSAHGKDDARWPEWSEVFAGVTTYLALALLLAPAAVAGALALGPVVWDTSAPGSVWDRAARFWDPARVAAEQATGDLPGEAPADELELSESIGRNGLTMLDALISPPEVYLASRRTGQIAEDLWRSTNQRAGRLLAPSSPSAAGIAARALLVLGLCLWPMALLAAAKLKSAYAALHVPMLVRSILRVPAGYLLLLGVFAVQAGLLVWLLTGLSPLVRGQLSPVPAHLLGIGLAALVGVSALVVTSSLLGRFYRSHAYELGWE